MAGQVGCLRRKLDEYELENERVGYEWQRASAELEECREELRRMRGQHYPEVVAELKD